MKQRRNLVVLFLVLFALSGFFRYAKRYDSDYTKSDRSSEQSNLGRTRKTDFLIKEDAISDQNEEPQRTLPHQEKLPKTELFVNAGAYTTKETPSDDKTKLSPMDEEDQSQLSEESKIILSPRVENKIKLLKLADSNATQLFSSGEVDNLKSESRMEIKNVDCLKIFNGDKQAIASASHIKTFTKIPDADFAHIASDCAEFKKVRNYITVPVSEEEENFPIAYIIQMYKNIVQLERLLRAIYRPQNMYCINVDLTSDESIHLGMTAIRKCFSNVIITTVDVKWASFTQIESDLSCMQLLYDKNKAWKYVITLAGEMFPLKTNLDIVKILDAMNGSNVMNAGFRRRNLDRWNFLPPPPVNVTLVKGACNFAVTRAFVRYVLRDTRALQFRNWTKKTLLPDEHFFQSLSHSPQLEVPGAFKGWPENRENGYDDIMRHVIWEDDITPCDGHYVRSVCVFGVGDLTRMADTHRLFANKFYYDYQPAALRCLEQRHYNWTRQDIIGQGPDRINLTFYRNLPNVKHHILSGLES